VADFGDDYPDDLPRRRPTSGAAIASLILGILSLFCSIFTGIPAIILGVIGIGATGPGRGQPAGRGLAVTGLIAGGVGMVLNGVLAYFALVYSVGRVREAAANVQSQNNLKMIGLSLQNYASTYQGNLPPAAVYDRNGKPLYSWRVLLLPFLESNNLYNQFHLDEPWDSPHNRQFIQMMPKVYQAPGVTTAEPGLTFYQVFTGPETPFPTAGAGLQPFPMLGKPGLQVPPLSGIGRIPDGTSNTFGVVEAADPVPWTKPDDLVYDARGPFPRLGGAFKNHFNAAFLDGSVRRVSKSADEHLLRAYINPNTGQLKGELP
jgi:hypothetical protein